MLGAHVLRQVTQFFRTYIFFPILVLQYASVDTRHY